MKKPIPHRKPLSVAVALAFTATAFGAHGQSLPSGGQVNAGAAQVVQSSATSMLVKQASERLSMNWQSFSIGHGHSVRFDQPSASSIALNRVIGNSRSEIYGSLSANGQVFLVNPNGVLFGSSAQVDVGGLVASTLNITDRDFLDGKYVFSDPSNRAAAINEGSLNGRYVALIGHQAINRGTVQADRGAVALGGGSTVELTLADNRLVKFEVAQSALDALAENGGLIRANGGQVILTAGAKDSLLASAVNNTGVIEARTVERQAGNILLLSGTAAGTTHVGGTLDAGASNGGDGGFIETSGARVKVADDARVTTKAANGRTGKWLIDPQDYTIASSGGDITGATLSGLLSLNNVEIQSSSGGTAGNGDINVNDAVSWSVNELTLTAARDININAVMSATGTSTLVMNTGTANGADAGVAGGTVKVGLDPVAGFSGRVDFDRSGTGFLTINGEGYTVINSLGAEGSTTGADLQGMNGNLAGRYALGAGIDASATSGWNAGAGFAPVGSLASAFTGVFDGLGHTVSGLTIDRPSASQVGLFGNTTSATLRNVDLAGSVTGQREVGGLVGRGSSSTIHNVRAGVAVTAGGTAGGLAGLLDGGRATDAHASGSVTGGTGPFELGGLVGLASFASLDNVSASGDVNAGSTGVGGLVGYNAGGSISKAQASGDLTSGTVGVGGLVGINDGGSIADSFATGDVTTGANGVGVGGLVGQSISAGASIVRSHAEGSVLGRMNVGGLVGENAGELDTVYATGSVSGFVSPSTTSGFGGLAGINSSNITNAYATGAVSYAGGTTNFASGVGGLIGVNSGAVSGSYANGNVTVSGTGASLAPSEDVGGLIGENHGTLTTVQARGAVSSTGTRTGGLAGFNDAAILQATVESPSVTGGGDYTGGLVGRNEASIGDSVVYGDVTSQGNWVGGAVGYSINGTLTNVTAEGTVLANGAAASLKGRMVGGLVGQLDSGSIVGGQAVGSVTGQRIVGGLVGFLGGGATDAQNITDSRAVGAVTATEVTIAANAGGLIGQTLSLTGAIQNVEATGNVTAAGDNAGGLIGRHADGTVSNAVASGRVQGRSNVGGLIGFGTAIVQSSHAQGDVIAANNAGVSNAGGLIGYSEADVQNAYATGSVQATGSMVGGLIGQNAGIVADTYATGAVSGPGSVGGLIGANVAAGSVTDAYTAGAVTGTGSDTGGLIGTNTSSSTLSSVHATGTVTSTGVNTGGLIGFNSGTVTDAYATSMVTGGTSNTGGLIGSNVGDVTASYYDTGTVTGNGSNTGGLIGSNTSTFTLSGVHSGGVVNGVTNTGGLIGYNVGIVSDAYATAAVSGSTATGGLIGYNDNVSTTPLTISRVHATGNVTGVNTTGGLIGDVQSAAGSTIVSDAYATGAVAGTNNGTGGLIGRLDLGGTATRVYASGAVTGSQATGGLVGVNVGTIQDAYATGHVTGTAPTPRVGGVVGFINNSGSVQRVYAAGPITAAGTPTANQTTGAVIGENAGTGLVGELYWDASVLGGALRTIGGTSSTAGRLNGTQAKTQSSYAGFDFTSTWVIYEGFTYPLLRSFLTPLTVTANNAAKTYDGALFSGGNGVTYSATPTADLLGTLGYGGTAQGARNAGSYALKAEGLYSHQQGYLITFVDGILNVAQAPLTLSTSSVTKTYDGTTAASGTAAVAGGTLFAGDTLSGGSFAFLDKNAGTGKSVTAGGVTVNDGNGGGNYNVSYVDNTTSTITPAPVSASGIVANNKVYDGTTTATLDTSAASALSGVIGGDAVSLPVSGLTGSFADKNVGAGKAVSLSGVALTGADAGNYFLTSAAPVTADITPASLTISGITAANKVYDGTTSAAVNTAAAVYTGLIAGDVVSVSATGSFGDKNVGAARTVTLSNSYGGADAGNYTITGQAGATADITPRALTVTANSFSKVEGTTYTFAGTEFSTTGLAAGETIGGVLLASAGAARGATVAGGPYAITASGASGGSFDPANYTLSYVDGVLVVVSVADSAEGQGAITSAQQVDAKPRLGEASRTLGFTIVGAGVNLPQGEE